MPARFTGRREPVVRGAGSGAARKSHPAHTSRDGLSASASWAGSKPAYPSGSLRPQTGQTPVLSSSLRSAAGPRLPEQEGPERKEGTQPQCNVERWESISGIPDSVGGSVIVEGQALCDDPALFAPTLTTAPVREPAELTVGALSGRRLAPAMVEPERRVHVGRQTGVGHNPEDPAVHPKYEVR